MIPNLNSKKAVSLTAETLVTLLIAILSIGVISILLAQLINQGDEATLEFACRTSVLQRAAAKQMTGVNLGKLACKTIDKDIGLNSEDSKEIIMGEIADHSMKCWNMFGEGVLSTLSSPKDLGAKVGETLDIWGWFDHGAYCFICYDMEIRSIEGSQTILQGDFKNYISNKVYLPEQHPPELNCDDGIDNDGNDIIDCGDNLDSTSDDDPNCQIVGSGNRKRCIMKELNPCVSKGGSCKTECENILEVEYRDPLWTCGGEDKCCLNKNDVYTYNDYIRYHGGYGGNILPLNSEDGVIFEEDIHYGIGYVEPIDDDKKESYIVIGKYADLIQNCDHKGLK